MRSIEDLLRIVNAGGGMTVEGTRPIEDLMKLVRAASASKAKLIIMDSEYKSTEDLVRLAGAAGGQVAFE